MHCEKQNFYLFPQLTKSKIATFKLNINCNLFIGQNIKQISDILSFAAEQNIEGIATFIDFEKAFDSLEWEFLLKTIETFNFGPDF